VNHDRDFIVSDDTIKSVRRVFEIIEYFDEVQKPLSLADIAARFRYPTSSSAAMLKSMMLLGYLNYDPIARTYLPTTRLSDAGGWVKSALLNQETLVSAITSLAERTGEGATISAQCDIYMQYLYMVYSDSPQQYRLKPGTIRPVTASGAGWMLLSQCSDDTIENLWRRGNRLSGQHKPALPLQSVMDRVNGARSQGYVVSRNTLTQGAGLIAMLVPEQFFGRTLVLGVGAPVRRLDEKMELIMGEMRKTIAGFTGAQPRAIRFPAEDALH
jgi:IclR family KDG regulon transcriptional repressor